MASIFCYGEAAAFPDAQFRRDPSGQLHVPYIHEIGTPHFSTGQPLHQGPDPVLVQVFNKAGELHRLALVMSKNDLQDVIDYARTKLQA